MNELLTKLSAPFHPSRVTFKPGAVNRDKTKALALPYADLRAYQDRLDEVCGLDWSVSYTPWGDRIICHLTIAGVTRSSTGEADSQSERSEIAGTSAEAQAMKRACAMFGLGRYLYSLPSLWVEYDVQAGRFTDQGKERLTSLIAQHYQRVAGGEGRGASNNPREPDVSADPPPTEWDRIPGADETDRQLRALLDEAGRELYGTERWPQVLAKNAKRLKSSP